MLSDDFKVYVKSKLALTMWSRVMAHALGENGLVVIAVNLDPILGSKMVRDGFGVAGGDIKIGAAILTRLASEHNPREKFNDSVQHRIHCVDILTGFV